MSAFVYRGAEGKALEDRPIPSIQNPGDAIARLT